MWIRENMISRNLEDWLLEEIKELKIIIKEDLLIIQNVEKYFNSGRI